MASRLTRSAVSSTADHLRSSLWPVPVACIALALVLGVTLPRLDRAVDDDLAAWLSALLFGGGPAAARTVLGAVASSLITVTALTFSLTVVTLQLASSQYSPRLLRTFSRDRFVHWTLGVLLGTFIYSLTILRTVRSPEEGGHFVPRISVTTSYVLAVLSVISLVLFLSHLAQEIRVETVLRRVHKDATRTIDDVLARDTRLSARQVRTAELPEPPGDATVLLAASSGFVTEVDASTLLEAAHDARALIRLDMPPGSWIVEGTPIGTAWVTGGRPITAEHAASIHSAVSAAVVTGSERTAVQDISFGLRQLTDVAVKALSPGINDPTTAIHALGHGSALLTRLARRATGPVVLESPDGRVLLVRPDLAQLLELVVAGPRRYGAADPDVLGRVLQLLREVAWVAPEAEHDAVRQEVTRTRDVVSSQQFDGADASRLAGLAIAALRALDEHRS